MYWKKDDGIAVAEIITLFALVSIMTFSALPFYNNLITRTHQIEVETTYNRIKTAIIMSTIDSIANHGISEVPYPKHVKSFSRINISNSSSWANNGDGIWTYIPTGAQIIYDMVEWNNFSLRIEFPK